MRRTFSRRPSGFTVIEMAIASLIALVIFAVGFFTISASTRMQSETTRSLRQAENARLFFELLERDLAGAYPAWHLVNKIDLRKRDKPEATMDAFEFFARADSASATPDAIYLIRYYAVPKDGTGRTVNQVRRNVMHAYAIGSPLAVDVTSIPAFDDPALLNDSTGAVFDEVDKIQFNYRVYHPETKTFDPVTESADLTLDKVPQATHLLVRLFLKDDGRGNQLNDPMAPKSTTNIVLPRMYQKLIALPEAFTQ